MEDSRIRRALEAVAGFYLTGTGRDAGTTGETTARDNGTGEEPLSDPFVDGPGEPDAIADPDPETALSPAEPRDPAGTATDPPAATDQLDPSEPGPDTAPRVEAVLLGHLPGYATPWISQYAHHLAERHGSAALLRVEGGTVRIERFDANDEDDEHRSPNGDDAEAPADDEAPGAGLTEVLAELSPDVGACVVSLERREGGEPDRAKLGELPRWTLLSGTDDAATVGGYRLLKGLLGVDGPGEPEEGIGVMFMGCDEDAAHGAVERLRQATEAHLGVAIEMAGVHPRFEPVRRCSLGAFELGEAGWERLRAWLEDFRRNGAAAGSDELAPWMEAANVELSEEEIAALHAPDAPEPASESDPAHGTAQAPDNGETVPVPPEAPELSEAPEPPAASEASDQADVPSKPARPHVTVTADAPPPHRGEGRERTDAADDRAAERDADSAARRLHGEVIRMDGGLGFASDNGSATPAADRATEAGETATGEPAGAAAGTAETGWPAESLAPAGAPASSAEPVEPAPTTTTAAGSAGSAAAAGSNGAGPNGAESNGTAADATSPGSAATAEPTDHHARAAEPTNPAYYLDGVEPIEAWCPRHPEVQLALDGAGRLHLALFESGAGTLAGGARRLLEASRWAREHRSLIGLTLRNRELDPRAEPTLHLMTDEPRAAVDLSLMGLAEDRAIRLHLLKAVTIEGRTIHVHEPLN